MVITILEAEVRQELREKLKRVYHDKTRTLPEHIIQSYLGQSQSNPTTWRILTVWRSQADLDAMRSSGETPTGVLIFQEVEATPQLSIFEVTTTAR